MTRPGWHEGQMLTDLVLSGFKSFFHVALDLGNLTLIVGANASGKSNIRDALRFLHGVGLGYSVAEILGGKYGAGGILQWRGVRGGAREIAFGGADGFALQVGAQIDDSYWPDGQRALWFEVEVDVTDERLGPRVTREALYYGDSGYHYHSDPIDDPLRQGAVHELKVRQRRGGKHRAHGKVSTFPSHTPALSQFPHMKGEPASLKRACESVLDVLRSIRFLDLDPDAMREPSPPGQVVLGDRGENLSSVLQAICLDPERKEVLLGWLRSLTPMDATDFVFKLDLNGRVLVYLVEGNGQETSAVSASDGTLRFLALVAALLSPDTGRIYFFEELDNGIHPTRLHLLLELIQQACKREGIQVIGTTHNPALLAFLDYDARQHAQLVYRPEGSSESKVRRIMDLPDVERILATQDLGRLHASGWLEDAAAFSEPAELQADDFLDDEDDEAEP